MIEKLTITKFGPVRQITGTNAKGAYAFNSIGFLTREHGDKKWFNIAFKEQNPLKEGTTYELEIKERSYTKKDGTSGVAFDAKLPSEESKMSKLVFAHELAISKLIARVEALEKREEKKDIEIPVINDEDPFAGAFPERPITDEELPF